MKIKSYEELNLSRHGRIEASAGTGKTYTLIRLVLRYLTEETFNNETLSIKQIVLLTFTRAAASEIKTRLLTLLKSRIISLEVQQTRSADEEKQLLHLKEAVEDFDEALIGTIHSFCQQILTSHPFETSLPLTMSLSPDTSWQIDCVRDFLRKYEIEFSDSVQWGFQCFLSLYNYDAETTFKALSVLADQSIDTTKMIPSLQEEDILLTKMHEFNQKTGNFYQHYQCFLALEPLFDQDILVSIHKKLSLGSYKFTSVLSQKDLYKNLKTKNNAFDLLMFIDKQKDSSHSFLEETDKLQSKPAKLTSLSEPESLFMTALINFSREVEPFFRTDEGEEKPYKAILCGHFLRYSLPLIIRMMDSYRAGNKVLSFNDLIRQTRFLLEQPDSPLLHKVSQEYRVLLIDEFQDTDEDQWSIFKHIFIKEHHSCMTIGDPKQAIYSFRGANLPTYFKASQSLGDSNLLQLEVNYRSRATLLSALNFFFSRIFSSSSEKNLHYQNIVADEGKSSITEPSPSSQEKGICFLSVPAPDDHFVFSPSAAKEAVIYQFGYKILSLIHNNDVLIEKNGLTRSVTCNDIAILCRTNTEAQQTKRILSSMRIPSVLLRSDSVYNSEEAKDLLLLLHVLTTTDEKMEHRLLVGPLFNLSPAMLQNNDLSSFFRQLNYWRLLASKEQWALLFDDFLKFSKLYHRLLAREDHPERERQYSNLRHLIEILIELGKKTRNIHNLYRQFNRLVTLGEGRDEETLRIERDDHAVAILTLHHAKGLQYPIVFALHGFKTYKPFNNPYYLLHQSHGTHLDFFRTHHIASELEKKEAEEEKRLFYVGLTRAEARLYLPLLPLSPCMYTDFLVDLLDNEALRGSKEHGSFYHRQDFGKKDITKARSSYALTLYEELKNFLHQEKPGFSLDYATENNQDVNSVMAENRTTLKLLPVTKNFFDFIEKVSSYSSLWLNHTQDHYYQENEQDDQLRLAETDTPSDEDESREQTMLNVKGSSDFGSLVHLLFEHTDFTEAACPYEDFKKKEPVVSLIRSVSTSFFNYYWAKEHEELLLSMLWNTLNQPVMALNGLQLHAIKKEQKRHEFEFLLYIREESFIQLKNFHSVLGKGFLKGFIDLIFSYDGKLYILDWKTTKVGNSFADYEQNLLATAMDHHGYTLQYYIYLCALYQYGKSINTCFSYEDDIGGVLYCFNRATSEEHRNDCGFFFDKPSAVDFMNFYQTFIREA